MYEGSTAPGFGPDPPTNRKKWGYSDSKGQIVIPAKFDEARPFAEDLAAVAIKQEDKDDDPLSLFLGGTEKWGFINVSGDFVISPQYFNVGDFSEGLASVAVKQQMIPSAAEDVWGFVDKTGAMRIKPQYYSTEKFVNGQCWVSIGVLRAVGRHGSVIKVSFLGKHGYIDKTGRFTKTSAKARYAHLNDD